MDQRVLDLQIMVIYDCEGLFCPIGVQIRGVQFVCVCVVWKLTAIPLRVMRFDSRLSTVRLVFTLRTSANC